MRKYGVEAVVDFILYETDGASLKTDAVHVSGDSVVMKDEGAEANTDNGFVDEGKGYSITLSATEMTAKRVVVYVVDQTSPAVWLEDGVTVETYGHASAMHAFDLNTATQSVTATTVSDKTGYGLADDAITSAKFDESTAFPLASADTGATAVARVGADSDTLETLSDEIAGLNDPTAATIADAVWDELSTGHVDAGKAGAQLWTDIDAILADTGTDGVVLADNAITAGKVATNAIDAGAIAADAIGSSELATAAVNEIVAAVWAGLTAVAKQAIADALLSRDVTNVEDSASNNSLAELTMAALNSAVEGTTLTIKKPSDDSTFNTRTVTTDATADPITGVT